jgi:hypothetical protein
MIYLNSYKKNLLIVLIFLIYTLGSFAFYHEGTLNGDLDNHILSGEMFGTPEQLKERGIKPLFTGEGQTGWDGQFYYYISNDLLGVKDTPEHLDAPSYRYQRVGLSLYVALVSKISGKDWVSPTTFFVSYLLLLVVAVWVGAKLFNKLNIHSIWILLWAFGIGTQITLFNALPDAAADAFLILALSAVIAKRFSISVVPFALAALSREVYVLFPTFILLFFMASTVIDRKRSCRTWSDALIGLLKWQSYYLLVIPGLIAVAWLSYVTVHFGVAPAEQAHGIVGFPFVGWFEYLLSGLEGNHKLVGTGYASSFEAATLILFMGVLIFAGWLSTNILFRDTQISSSVEKGVALASLAFVLLYISFGPTVIMHYTGYFKALGIFFFLIPVMLAYGDFRVKFQIVGIGLVVCAVLVSSLYNMKVRILPHHGSEREITRMHMVTETKRIECFGNYDARVEVEGITIKENSFVASALMGRGRGTIIIDLMLNNTGENPFVSTRNFGSVHMSYHWVDAENNVVVDGIRTAIPDVIMPGQTMPISVTSPLPATYEDLHLKLSPVQEGCSWFYLSNPSVSEHINLTIK